jgi:hypothetical protein
MFLSLSTLLNFKLVTCNMYYIIFYLKCKIYRLNTKKFWKNSLKCCYAKCHSVELFLLSVILVNVVAPLHSPILPRPIVITKMLKRFGKILSGVVMPNAIQSNVFLLSVILVNVVAPLYCPILPTLISVKFVKHKHSSLFSQRKVYSVY